MPVPGVAWWRRIDPRGTDVVLAAVVALLAVVSIGHRLASPPPVEAALLLSLTVAQQLPLLWRRAAPGLALAAAVAVLTATRLAGYPANPADGVVLAILIYTLGAVSRRPRTGPAVAIAAIVASAVALNLSWMLRAWQGWPLPASAAVGWLTNIVGLSGILSLAYLLGRIVAQHRRRTATAIEHAATVESNVQRRVEQAVGTERTEIARELHDLVAHSLGHICLEAEAAERIFQRDPDRARLALAVIATAGRHGLDDMRSLLLLLRHPQTPASRQQSPPTLADLPALVAGAQRAGLQLDLETSGELTRVPHSVQLSAYRIVQESLTNTIKHAGRTRARVNVDADSRRVMARITDHGEAGAAAPHRQDAAPHRHDHVPVGILGMRERTTLFGGRLDAGPTNDGGWQVTAVLPLPPPEPPEAAPAARS